MRTVRRARPEDARGIHEAHMRSIREHHMWVVECDGRIRYIPMRLELRGSG